MLNSRFQVKSRNEYGTKESLTAANINYSPLTKKARESTVGHVYFSTSNNVMLPHLNQKLSIRDSYVSQGNTLNKSDILKSMHNASFITCDNYYKSRNSCGVNEPSLEYSSEEMSSLSSFTLFRNMVASKDLDKFNRNFQERSTNKHLDKGVLAKLLNMTKREIR